jgi:hypothetical protein
MNGGMASLGPGVLASTRTRLDGAGWAENPAQRETRPGRYLGKFDSRYSTRQVEDGERTKLAIHMAEGKRLSPGLVWNR